MERLQSQRYRWEGADLLDSKKGHKQQQSAQAPGADYIMLRQRVAQTLDTTGWGTILVMADVSLSVLSVLIYIALTYHPINALYHLDLALACIFSLNWLFWFWVAEDRLRYVFSFLTAVDVVTIAPSFVLYGLSSTVAETVPGLNFLRVLRILRVLRVFRMKNIMQRHIEGAVMEAAGKLIFSLISIIFIAAGLFYELEKYGPVDDEKKTKDLKFHQSIYWATITLTTVGYGDIVPTYWATQVMVIGLLMLTFTLLPYLTGNLMSALTRTSTYQRRSFKASRRPDVSHVVITGFLDGATVAGLLDELYHEDKGFNHNYAVLLSEQPPSLDIQHVLATHPASRKLTYLHGSPFRPTDLWRAASEYASAFFIIAPKYPEDATLADRYLSMCALSLGQYLQEVHAMLQDRLKSLPERITHWIQHGTVVPPGRLPAVYLQVCLPEGRLRLFQVLQSLQESRLPLRAAIQAATRAAGLNMGANGTGAAAGDAAVEQAEEEAQAGEFDTLGGSKTSRWHPELGGDGPGSTFASGAAGTAAAGAAAQRAPPAAAARSDLGPNNGDARVDLSAYQALSPHSLSKSSAQGGLQQQQQQQLGKGGCAPWWAPLTAGFGSCTAGPASSYKPLPTGTAFWEEFSGSIHLLCLSEIKYAMMAQSVVGVPGVMTLLCNLSTTVDFGLELMQESSHLPAWMRDYMVGASQELYKLRKFPTTLVGRTMKEAAGFIFDSCHAVLLAVEPTTGLQQHRMIVGDLQQVITPDMRGYIIADDISAVLLTSAAQEGDFELWNKLRQQHLKEQLAGVSSSGTAGPGKQRGPASSSSGSGSAAGKQRGLQSSSSGGASGSGKQGGESKSSGGGKAAQPTHWRAALAKSSSLVLPGTQPHRPLAAQVQQRWSGTSPGSILGLTSTGSESFDEASVHDEPQPEAAADSSTRRFARHPLGDGPEASGMSATVRAVAAACGAVGITRRVTAGHASALGALVHLLRSPSRVLRSQGHTFLREHYHMRPQGAVQLQSFMEGMDNKDKEVDLSNLSGHILLLGVPASTDGLLALLAVLRSKRLLQWRPVVIIDSNAPSGGGSWEAVAQFKDVYFIQATDGLNDALLRASAERASQAILMTPLITHDFENEDQRLASKVMIDAMVVNRYQLLKSINPDIEMVTEMMLTQNMSYLAPTVPVHGVQHKYMHLLSPAYISGSVFQARQLDDLMTASYCNGASDRIVLQLLHRWHMGWAGVQAFSSLAREQQELMPSHHAMLQGHGRVDGPRVQQQWRDRMDIYQALKQQQQQDESQQQDQQQDQQHTASTPGAVGSGPWTSAQGPGSAHNSLAALAEGRQQLQQERQQERQQLKRFRLAATAVLNQISKTAGPKVAQGTAAAIAARAAEKHGVPTLMQIPVECPPGTTYGRYFHLLLHIRGLLLLGVYRRVPASGPHFRAVITNPSYHSDLLPDDHAFVVARLPLPADCSDSAAVAAAWPPDTLGFGHHTTPQQSDLLVPPAAAVQEQQYSRSQAQQGSGGTPLHAWGLPGASSPTSAGPESHQLDPEGLGDSSSMTLGSSSAVVPAAFQQPQQQPMGRRVLCSSDSGFMPPTHRNTAAVNDDGVVTAAQMDVRGGQMQGQPQSSGGAQQRFVSVSSPGVQGALLFPVSQQQQQQQGQQQQQQQPGQPGQLGHRGMSS